jgi:hypothetical protein
MTAEPISTNGQADVSRPRELQFSLGRDAWGQLILIDAEGKRHLNVQPVPMFPISDPGQWVSIVGGDGHEIVCLENLEQIAPEVRTVLADELALREFVPVIERIVWVSGNSEPCEGQVETDRGPTQFVLTSEEDVRRLGPHQILIVDANGIRYQIPDLRKVDAKSRRIVEWYV